MLKTILKSIFEYIRDRIRKSAYYAERLCIFDIDDKYVVRYWSQPLNFNEIIKKHVRVTLKNIDPNILFNLQKS